MSLLSAWSISLDSTFKAILFGKTIRTHSTSTNATYGSQQNTLSACTGSTRRMIQFLNIWGEFELFVGLKWASSVSWWSKESFLANHSITIDCPLLWRTWLCSVFNFSKHVHRKENFGDHSGRNLYFYLFPGFGLNKLPDNVRLLSIKWNNKLGFRKQICAKRLPFVEWVFAAQVNKIF
jgi:hypothetical protein